MNIDYRSSIYNFFAGLFSRKRSRTLSQKKKSGEDKTTGETKMENSKGALPDLAEDIGHLSPEEKNIIRESWTKVYSKIADIGVFTFVGLFSASPAMKKAFSRFRDHDLDDLTCHPEFRKHTMRVMHTVEKAVHRIDEIEDVPPALTAIGASHRAYGICPVDIMEMHPHFLQAMSKVLGDEWTSEVETAWSKFFVMIIKNLQHGMTTGKDT